MALYHPPWPPLLKSHANDDECEEVGLNKQQAEERTSKQVNAQPCRFATFARASASTSVIVSAGHERVDARL